MPAAPRPKSKATKIFYNILGYPVNSGKKKKLSKKEEILIQQKPFV